MHTIYFKNPCNLGDVHVSRELIKYAMKVLPAKRFVYCHKHHSRLTSDITQLEHANQDPSDLPIGSAVLSTWYADSPAWHEGRGMGCTLNTLVELFRMHFADCGGHELEASIENFIPTYDFTFFHTAGVDDALSTFRQYKTKVLVANGECLSGQTNMPEGIYDFALADLVKAYPDVLFLFTNESALRAPNLLYTAKLIGLPPGITDLPEHAYLSRFCDVIIGRGSGPYTYAYTLENLMNEKKLFVCFTDDPKTAQWVYPVEKVKASISISGDYTFRRLRESMATAIDRANARSE